MAHIYGAFLDGTPEELTDPEGYPLLALVVSGGHTSLVLVSQDGSARQLGCTIDDAAGEALDKGSKLLDLGYPGGPVISRIAENGNPSAFDFPRPLTGGAGKALAPEHRYNFSFSGIKTALLYHTQRNGGKENFSEEFLNDTVASYQMAVVDTLCRKTILAAKDFKVKQIVLAGGVACNKLLRQLITERAPKNVKVRIAPPKYCTDNAAMVGGIGYHSFKKQEFISHDADSFARLPGIVKVPFL
jgi:N6-L-threonylcarbamoyladenine synthase